MNEQGTHFYLAAMQVFDQPGGSTFTRAGTYTPSPGETRFDSYTRIIKAICTDMDFDRFNVLHFQLEPNQL